MAAESAHIRSRDLGPLLPPRATQVWVLHDRSLSMIVAVDGSELWRAHLLLLAPDLGLPGTDTPRRRPESEEQQGAGERGHRCHILNRMAELGRPESFAVVS